MRYELRSPVRGRYTVGPVSVQLVDPFGLCRATRQFATTDTLTVVPATVPLPGIPLGRYWRPLFAWFGDLDLVPHLWQMVCLGETEVGGFFVAAGFCAHGIAGAGGAKKVGRIGAKALLYFEVVSTIALIIGLIVVVDSRESPSTCRSAKWWNSRRNSSRTDPARAAVHPARPSSGA